MTLLTQLILARGSSSGGSAHIHLTPGEIHALLTLTRWVGYQFWHATAWVQCAIVGVPSAAGIRWLHRWDPLKDDKD